MTFKPLVLTSIHGRRLGVNSSGAILAEHNGVMSAAVTETSAGLKSDAAAQSAIATGSTFTNFGRQAISSGTATAQSLEIAAPVAGIEKEILIGTSASELTLGGTATAVIFKPAIAGAGSSVFMSAVNLAGSVIKLRGVSTTQWSVIGSTTAMTIG
jgi:hypothetical protein